MKGIVFTEFLGMVEDEFGYEMVDTIIEGAHLESQGAYTAIGTYPHQEMVALVSGLSTQTGVQLSELLRKFGHHLFQVFVKNYGVFFENCSDGFSLLESIENYIHVEVRKLYPDAELPSFSSTRQGDDTLILDYSSSRKMGDFALGLIEATMAHFGSETDITQENLAPDSSVVRFTIKKVTA
jgi:hypothetical protein